MTGIRNILFIMADQLRWDYLGCTGYPTLKTPHTDALARRGVLFDRTYCQAPVCGPSADAKRNRAGMNGDMFGRWRKDKPMSVVFVYITTGTAEEARHIGGSLVEARLAACANILEGMTSVYRWEDEIREESEAVLIAKTRTELVEEVVAWVKEIHSYDCPCIVVLPVKGGNIEFLDWITKETTEDVDQG